MKRLVHCLCTLLLCYNLIPGQNNDSLRAKPEHQLSFSIGALYSPVLLKNFYGVYMDVKYYPTKKFATGLELSISEKKITDTFNYSIQEPILTFCEFGWINQYDVIQSERMRIGLNINNGIAVARLGDNAIKETYYTEYGCEERAKKVASNVLYLLEPGADLSVRLFSIKNFSNLFLTATTKYRFVFGNCKYGKTDNFKGHYVGLGILFTGFN